MKSAAWLPDYTTQGDMGGDVQDYYFSDWTEEERAEGLHLSVMKFANESKSQRGLRRLEAEAQTTPHDREII